MNTRIKELVQPITWLNNCNESAVAALRYLAEHPRPAYGNSAYNTEHLYMIAGELTCMASQNLYSQDYVSALNAALKLNLCRIAELESQLQSGFTPEALAQEERAENAEDRIAGLEQALELEREKSRRVMSENHQQAKHIAQLERAEQRLCAANVSLDARAELAERRNTELKQLLATPVALDGYCIMPVALTAENGAKAALSGEFKVSRTVACNECGGAGCDYCDDSGEFEEEIIVPWSIIKAIYRAAVDTCRFKAPELAQEVQP
ncbi:TPA: hypothetical protein ACKQDZ_000255 [Serratia rubidaea]